MRDGEIRNRRRMNTIMSSRGTLLLLAALAAPALAAPPQPVRMTGKGFGERATIEVRDLSRQEAESAIRRAFSELDQARSDATALERATLAGKPVAVDGQATELLRRAQAFCVWSEGAVGPLGGRLFELWGLDRPASALPTPDALTDAVASANCDRMAIDSRTGQVTVDARSRLDLFPFALGWGVDRAADLLRQQGSADFWISVGPLTRAVGPGPDGRGWAVAPATVPGATSAPEPFYLRDQTAAILTPRDRPLVIAGESYPPYIDLRKGRPGHDIQTLMAITELAIDAEGVAYAMYALGPADGMLLVGSLQPRPAIRWYLGGGSGPPVITDVNWSSVTRR
jgi:thiamine biosynthesis lipoprotein